VSEDFLTDDTAEPGLLPYHRLTALVLAMYVTLPEVMQQVVGEIADEIADRIESGDTQSLADRLGDINEEEDV
jgi:hypothetical protein